MKYSLISFFFSILLFPEVTAQPDIAPGDSNLIIAVKEGRKKTYQLNGKYLNSSELETVLKSNPLSEFEFQKYISFNKTGRNIAVPALIVMNTGLIFLIKGASEAEDDNQDQASRYQAVGFPTFIIGCILNVIGTSYLLSSNSHFKKSIIVYNETVRAGWHGNIIVTYGFIGNGIGVRLKF